MLVLATLRYSQSFTFIHIHSQSFTFIHNHLHSITFIRSTLLHACQCCSTVLHPTPHSCTLLHSPPHSTMLIHTPPFSSKVLHALQCSSTLLQLSIILIHVNALSSTFINSVQNKTQTYYYLGHKSNCWISRYQCSNGKKHIERKTALWICWGRTIWA